MSATDLKRELERFDPTVPIERARMPPSSWYTSPEFFELEKRAVFARSWQPVARVAAVAAPGSYASGCLAGQPWVVVRGREGTLSAFHNVCRHKGREVVTGAGIANGSLVCGYHGWAYGYDGRLTSAPRIAGILDFDRDAMSLRPLRVETWGPWIFVNGDLDAPPIGARLSSLHTALDEGAWDALEFVETAEWTLQCNWKVAVDNYLDGGYHIPHMHPSLDAQLDMKTYRTELFDGFSIQTAGSSTEDAGQRVGPGAIYAWLYPNFMINRYGDCMDSNVIVPLGVDRCKVVYEFYFGKNLDRSTLEARVRASIEQSGITQREDIEICESVQRGLSSFSYEAGRYAPRVEHGEHHFHRMVHEDLRRALES